MYCTIDWFFSFCMGIRDIYECSGLFCCLLFFFISGLLFYRNFEIEKLLEKWKSRVFTVIIPYLIWASIYYLYSVLCTNFPVIRDYVNRTPISFSILEWLKWLWPTQYYSLWFLKNLIVFIALAPVIWLLFKNHHKYPIGLIALMVIEISLYQGWVGFPDSGGLSSYILGAFIGLNCKKLMLVKNRVLIVTSSFYLLVMFITSFKYWNPVTELLFYLAVWYVLDLFVCNGRLKIRWWMNLSFFVYVAHDILLECFEKVLWVVFKNNPVIALADYLLMPILIVATLSGIAYVLIMYFPRLWKTISENRINKEAVIK